MTIKKFRYSALAAVGLVAAPLPGHADTLRARYSVSIIGLPVGTASATANLGESNYKLEIGARLTGLASVISSFKAALVATGAHGNGRLAPNAYATSSATSEETRTVRMAMTGGNVDAVEIVPPIETPPDLVPVSANDKRRILDPVSAALMEVPQNKQPIGPAACDRTLPIFDGYTRFDLTLSYVGLRNVKVKGYSGPVSVCAVRFIPVSGHRPGRKAVEFMRENKEIEVWLAPIEGTHAAMPLRVSVLTMAGTLVVDATEFVVERNRADR
jgi:hypothetical protein